MFNNQIIRSLLQVIGLSVAALFLTTASPKAAPSATAASAFDECDDEYAACVERCGTYTYYWDGTYDFDPVTQMYDLPHYVWGWQADISYFECIPGWRYGDCECAG